MQSSVGKIFKSFATRRASRLPKVDMWSLTSLQSSDGKLLKSSEGAQRTVPYVKPVKTKVVSYFTLGRNIAVTIGLNGSDPEVRFSQTQGKHTTFVLSAEEFMQLSEADDLYDGTIVLSSVQVSGGYYNCVTTPTDNGIELQHRLIPSSGPRDESEVDGVSRIFHIPKLAVSNLNLRLEYMLNCVKVLILNKPVFESMTSLIVRQLLIQENDQYGLHDNAEAFDIAYRLFRQHVPSSYMVRLFLGQKPPLKTSLQLYQVLEVCCAQLDVLRRKMNDGTVSSEAHLLGDLVINE